MKILDWYRFQLFDVTYDYKTPHAFWTENLYRSSDSINWYCRSVLLNSRLTKEVEGQSPQSVWYLVTALSVSCLDLTHKRELPGVILMHYWGSLLLVNFLGDKFPIPGFGLTPDDLHLGSIGTMMLSCHGIAFCITLHVWRIPPTKGRDVNIYEIFWQYINMVGMYDVHTFY